MPANFQVDGDQVTVQYQWTGPLDRYQEIVFEFAYHLWPKYAPTQVVDGEVIPIPYDELSAQQKLNMDYSATGRFHTEGAKAGRVNREVAVTRETEGTYADENLVLEED